MAVPDFQAFMRPILEKIDDGNPHRLSELYQRLAAFFALTPEDLEELLPSGKQAKYHNRILWAKFHLDRAGLLTTPARGVLQITELGRDFLRRYPQHIGMRELQTVPAYAEFIRRNRTPAQAEPTPGALSAELSVGLAPAEQIDALYAELNTSLAEELLTQVSALSPAQFERLVVEVLVAMGYGGSVRDAGQALGRSGDNGIDGLIKQDPLGLDRIYLQAKRWQNTVHSPEIRTFSGSLTYHKAAKGVFITTSTFSEGARATAGQIGNIILLDGHALSRLMIEYGVGVLTRETYQIRRVDLEYFEEL
ncbi:restriction endonuclease [Deinococcus wulumuqiensis]|uniref:Mrr restriction system protein n=2 Tax=Deinococcus wulumuqiensis TaxID=980427 RepID=A0AAV4K2Y1_9DEIO|nr:restriction endonuclease [Deinococcus wulumuqiensis]QII19368.1 restriction endonuclease [Deinococcus wulumuqiensis R12]GGI68484.1 mrr restriction system protein [Deinococcus wulumuqiensis]GGI77272.1 mrr restriction system protein [Deinococcus wulumuqiensis]